jgi:hypothetical protein
MGAVAVSPQKNATGLREVTFYEEYIPSDNPINIFLDTFVDPLELVVFANVKMPGRTSRNKMTTRRAVDYLLMTPISNRKRE